MSNPAIRILVALGATLALAASGAVVPTQADDAQRAASKLEAQLRPSGDSNGSGHADFTLNKARKKVCADVTWRNIQQPDAAHIHRASDGGIVVDLTGSVTGGSKCRTGVSKRLIGKILAHPGRYYFNVHNPTFPAGAIQGTLRS